MSVRWGDWVPFEASPGRPLHDVDQEAAARYFGEVIEALPARTEQLERLLGRNGVQICFDDVGRQRLDDWYQANVRGDDLAVDRLAPRWYAVGLDIGLYLGEAIRSREPEIEWRMCTRSPRDVSYQRPVLIGFPAVRNPDYYVDPELLVGIHGQRIVVGESEPRDYVVSVARAAET